VNLAGRTTTQRPAWCQLGRRILATPPTLNRRLLGTVVDIDGFAITIEIDSATYIAVDIEDCQPAR
jgi:hypothetical protein